MGRNNRLLHGPNAEYTACSFSAETRAVTGWRGPRDVDRLYEHLVEGSTEHALEGETVFDDV